MPKKPKRAAKKSSRTPRKVHPEMSTLAATIAKGQSLSDVVSITDPDGAVRVIMPLEWDSAVLTFRVSDGIDFVPLYNETGSEVRITVVPGTTAAVPLEMRDAVKIFKVHSGSHGNPIPQTADRVLQFILR